MHLLTPTTGAEGQLADLDVAMDWKTQGLDPVRLRPKKQHVPPLVGENLRAVFEWRIAAGVSVLNVSDAFHQRGAAARTDACGSFMVARSMIWRNVRAKERARMFCCARASRSFV